MYDLRDILTTGISAKTVHTVTISDTAGKYATGFEDLLSTAAVIRMAVQTSIEAIEKYMPEGYVSIGRSVEFEHTAPTRIGMKVTIEATVTDVQPLFIVLDIKASDEVGEIGFGKHKRSIITTENLIAKSKKRQDTLSNNRPF